MIKFNKNKKLKAILLILKILINIKLFLLQIIEKYLKEITKKLEKLFKTVLKKNMAFKTVRLANYLQGILSW